MVEFETLVLLAMCISAVASVIAYILAGKILPSATWLQNMGQKAYQQKMELLNKPPLSFYKAAAEKGEFFKGFLIIATAILIKSLFTLVAGLIAVFLLPVSIATIPAIAAAHGSDERVHSWLVLVTVMQGMSHLLTAGIGFAAAWIWIAGGANALETVKAASVFTLGLITASIVTALIAAWIETDGHINRGFLNEG